jgi:RimJ/RimL family protein N-acetyltransferase
LEHRASVFPRSTRAAGELVRCAFEDMDLERLRATLLRNNLASRRVLERLGFTVTFRDVSEVPRYGGPSRLGDTFMLERQDWQKCRNSSS